MSPQSLRILILALAAIAAVLLINISDPIYHIAGVIIASGAPAFRTLVQRTFERSGALNLLRAADLNPEDIVHNQSADQAFEDQIQVR